MPKKDSVGQRLTTDDECRWRYGTRGIHIRDTKEDNNSARAGCLGIHSTGVFYLICCGGDGNGEIGGGKSSFVEPNIPDAHDSIRSRVNIRSAGLLGVDL